MPDKAPTDHLSPTQQNFIAAATNKEAWITFGDEEARFTLRRWTLTENLTIAPLHAKIMSKVIAACPMLVSKSEREQLEKAASAGEDVEVNISMDQLVADTYIWETALGEVAQEISDFMVLCLKHNDRFGGDPKVCREYIDQHGDPADVMEVLLMASVLNKIDNTAKKKYLDLAGLYRIPDSPQS